MGKPNLAATWTQEEKGGSVIQQYQNLEVTIGRLKRVIRGLIPTYEPQTTMDLNRDGLIPSRVLVKMIAGARKEAVTPVCPDCKGKKFKRSRDGKFLVCQNCLKEIPASRRNDKRKAN
jgi:hypothetical protein